MSQSVNKSDSQSVNRPVHQYASQIDSHPIGKKATQSVSKALVT